MPATPTSYQQNIETHPTRGSEMLSVLHIQVGIVNNAIP